MKTLDRFFQIIDLLENNEQLRLQDIADKLNIDKSTIFRFLKVLEKNKFVSRDIETKKYKLGLKFINISDSITKNLNVIKIGHSYLLKLSNISGETIHLTMLEGNTAIYIDKVVQEGGLVFSSRIGKNAPLYCTGVGKVLFAYQKKEYLEKMLNDMNLVKYTQNTIINKKLLRLELKKIRENGFAIDNAEYEKFIYCIAAPVWDHFNDVKYSISISTFESKTSLDKLLEYKNVLIENCNLLSKELGYQR